MGLNVSKVRHDRYAHSCPRWSPTWSYPADDTNMVPTLSPWTRRRRPPAAPVPTRGCLSVD
jgi:hypothetical protein